MIYKMLEGPESEDAKRIARNSESKMPRRHPSELPPSTTHVDIYDKIGITIDSCTHWHQVAMVHKMIVLYKKRYGVDAEDMSLIRRLAKKERFLLSDEDKVDMKVQIEDLLNSTDRLEIS